MKFLGFQCVEEFRTSGSVGFDLSETMPPEEIPPDLKFLRRGMKRVMGALEIHYPCAGHIKAFVRVRLTCKLAQSLDRSDFKKAVEDLLLESGLPKAVTYEADLIPCDLVTVVDQRVNEDGLVDGLS
jgi:hypothetical protein